MQEKVILRKEFITEVRKFKIEHKVKLRDLFSETDESSVRLKNDFFSNPTIFSYLSRNAKKVNFLLNHPEFFDNKEEKTNNDYYELKIYKLNTKLTLFRNNVQSDQFYLAKTPAEDSASNFFSLRNNTLIANDEVFIQKVSDITNIRDLINWFEHKEKLNLTSSPLNNIKSLEKIKFILSPNWQDTHAMLMVHILDNKNSRVLATVFINSIMKEEQKRHIEKRFNNPCYYYYHINNDTFESIKNKFESKKLEKCEFFNEGRIGYRFNGDICASGDYYNNLIKNKDIDYIYDVYNSSLGHVLFAKRQIPFIDASHNLQLKEEDQNCVLYGSNFIEGIGKMLQDQNRADSIYQLAKRIDQGDTQANEELSLIFRVKLKDYLPCYYEKNGDTKSYEQIKEYHLHQRWDLDSEQLSFNTSLK
jgi:hypothetical protein